MSLDVSKNVSSIKNKDKEQVSIGFITMEEKLIYLNQYSFTQNLNEILDDFIQKNNENSLRQYFNFGENFNINNFSFYAKREDKLERIDFRKGKDIVTSLENLEDTINIFGNIIFRSFSTSNTNLDYLKIYVKYEERFKKLVENFEEYIIKSTHLIGKPQLNQTSYFRYDKLIKEIKTINCHKTDIIDNKINSFSFYDNYCNAKNYLYIYEGVSDVEIQFSKFFNINLIKNKITLISAEFPKRYLHSMIFIPSCYIFIIGGNKAKEVLTYEIDDQNTSYDIYPYQLPKCLLEPSLISINNKYIYILENSTISLNIYKMDLIKISPFEQIEIKNKNSMDQKFFGVVRNKNSILFLGGQKLNMNMKNNNLGKKYCYEYHYDTDKIVLSNREFSPIDFIEKTFIPIGDDLFLQFAEYKKDNKKVLKMVQFDGNEQEVEKSESNNS
jgi:hypothetical protein